MYFNHTVISPLEWIRELCKQALRRQKSFRASFVSFFEEAMLGVLTINGRINFLQLARFGNSGEQRFRRNFRRSFDWLAFNTSLVDKQPSHRYAIAIDPSYISKSGSKTPGVGYFWSGCAQAAKHGLEILGIALIDVNAKQATALRASQTLVEKKYKGATPKCLAHLKNDSLIKAYLRSLYTYREQLQQLSNLVVADAYFSNSSFMQGLDVLGFELVSRFRDNVCLKYLYTGARTGKRGRPKRFDGQVNLQELRSDVFCTETLVWDTQEVLVHSAIVYAEALKRNVKAVIVDFQDKDKKTQTRKIFFSTDCTLTAKEIIEIYRTRFQIEFLFRDAKQFTGLCHCQARDEKALDFAFNLSLSAVNVLRKFCEEHQLDFSIANAKLLMHNALMIERFLCLSGKQPLGAKNRTHYEHEIKELLFYGLKQPA